MDDKWSTRGKRARKAYIDNITALYSTGSLPASSYAPPKPAIKRSQESLEWHTQAKIVKWARSNSLPLISIPNHGKRSTWAGQKERAMGLTAGVSDLFLVLPNKKHHGYWIEVKAKGKKPTDLQYQWMEQVRKNGYKADWFDDYELAKCAIESYLNDC